MSKTIDERVVSMQFDNKRFESNVQTSLTTLDKLKQSLQLDGATKGLDNVDKAAKKVDMSHLGVAVEKVGLKFSALYTVADQALRNITNSVMNAGKQMASSFTIEPIKTGFSEYETQMNAVQTILANTESKGSTLQDVNNALNELNTYADKTIYNFTEMTRNIGTFTAAGVELDTSVQAIKGIANLAAVSGSTSQQASTAMYQLSQALSSGTVKLMDWNSVVNAGMGGQVFQDSLKETARVHGVAIDEMEKHFGSFRETLSEGWLTSEILLETLAKFTGDLSEAELKSMGYNDQQIEKIMKMGQTANDAATKVKTFTQLMDTLKEAAQSGWTQTWQIIVGDFGEAKEFLTEISDTFGGMIGEMSDSRNKLLSGALSTGWKQLLNEGINDAAGFEETVTKVAKEHGVDLSKMIDDETTFQDTLKDGWLTSDILADSIDKYGASLTSLTPEQLKARGYTSQQVEAFKELQQKVKDGTISLEEFSKLMSRPSGRELLIESLKNGLNAILSVIKPVKEAFEDVFPPTTADQLYNAIEKFRDFTATLTLVDKKALKVKAVFRDIFAAMSNVLDTIKNIFGPLKDAFSDIIPSVAGEQITNFAEGLKELTGHFKISEEGADKLKRIFKGVFAVVSIGARAIGALFRGFVDVVGYLRPIISVILSLGASIGDLVVWLNEVIGSSRAFQTIVRGIGSVIGSVLNVVKKFAQAISDTFSAIVNPDTSGITAFADKTTSKFKPVMVFFENLSAALSSFFDGVAPVFLTIASKIGNVFKGIFGAIGNFITNVDWKELLDLINSGLLTGVLIGLNKFLDPFSVLKEAAGGFLEGLAEIKDSLVDTFGALQAKLKAGTLIKIALAILVLVAALIALTFIDPAKLSMALAAIAGLFAELFGSMSIFNKMAGGKDFNSIRKLSTTLIAVSIAVLILSSAMVKLAALDWDGIAKGLVGIGGAALVLVLTVKQLSNGQGKIMKGATSLIILAAAVKILASVVEDLAYLSWNGLAKGLIGVGGIMAALVGFVKVAKFDGKMTRTAIGMVVLASAIKILASACEDFAYMSWEELAKGLAGVGSLLLMVAGFTRLAGNAKGIVSAGASLVLIGAAMKIFASAMYDISLLSWEDIAKGLLSIAGVIFTITLALNAMPKNTVGLSIGLIGIGAALLIMSDALGRIGDMSWTEVAKGLIAIAGAMGILVVAMRAIKGVTGSSVAIFVVAAALSVLAPVLKTLGSMSLADIGLSLLALAGAFTIIGLAAYVLKPLTGTLYALSGAMAVFGVAVALIGAGVLAFSIGLTGLAGSLTAVVTAIVAVVSALISLIPFLFEQIAAGIVAFCKVISDGIPAIGAAIKAIVFTIIDIIVECIPKIVDGILELINKLLVALVEYIPSIVDLIFSFLIAIIDGIAKNVPALIQSCVNLLMSVFEGTIAALQTVDMDVLMDGLKAIGFFAAILGALAAVSALIPGAIVGIIGMGVCMAELALVLAAVGQLNQIPGLMEFVSSGGDLLGVIGGAIGQFIGGIIGGIANGATSALPAVAINLAEFMTNIQPFIDGARSIDSSTMDGVESLVGVILALTAANVLEGLTSWFTGGSSISKFGSELAMFGPCIKQYADSISGIDNEAVVASATAAKALAEMTSMIPNEGGVAAWFAGENSISKFGSELVTLGTSLAAYSVAVKGIDKDSMIASAEAGKALAEMAKTVPNEGGVAAWFAGENSIAKFGTELVSLGVGLRSYSLSVKGIDKDAIFASAEAAKALTDMASTVPNEGGVAGWFAGENSIAKFGTELIALGHGLYWYSMAVQNIDVDSMSAATTAAKEIANMANVIPNEGGVVSWFAGDNSIAKFGTELIALGVGIKGFSDAIVNNGGINVESITAAVSAAKEIAGMTAIIPNSGGVVSWFAGDNSVSKFGNELATLGAGIKGFSDAITAEGGINVESVNAAVNAAKAIADMTAIIPNSGGMASWFTGDNSISKFGGELTALGLGLKGFSDAINGGDTAITPETMSAAASAGKAIAEMTTYIPTEGGMKAWFTGTSSISNFGGQLTSLGKGLRGFSDALGSGEDGINVEAVTAAAAAGKTLAEMVSIIPNEGGIKAWFSGESGVASFSEGIPQVGAAIKSFSDSVTKDNGIDNDSVTAAANAAKTLADMTATVPKDTKKILSFGENLKSFGSKLAEYFATTSAITSDSVTASKNALSAITNFTATANPDKMSSAASAIDKLTDSVKNLSKINESAADGFSAAMKKIGETNVDSLVEAFDDAGPKLTKAGESAIQKVIDAIGDKTDSAKKAFEKVVSDCVKAINDAVTSFSTAGGNLVIGFANGISKNTYLAKAKAKAMASAAAEAARKALDEHSPSKVGYEIGDFFGIAFVNALGDYADKAYNAGSEMASSAKTGLSEALSKVYDFFNSDMDSQPTIRPVIDLSDVRAGANAIGGMLSGRRTLSLDTQTANAISASMAGYQNGADSAEVVSAIKALRKDIANMPRNSYTVNGVTYDDGSNISDAVGSIVRALRIEGRT